MIRYRSLVAIVSVVLLLGGCGSSSKKSSTTTVASGSKANPPTSAGDNTSGGNSVQIKGFAFKPSALKVSAGTKVTWTNSDPADHTTTADKSDPAAFDSGHLGKGKTFSFTFAKKGTYKYFCNIHNYMTGTVEVS